MIKKINNARNIYKYITNSAFDCDTIMVGYISRGYEMLSLALYYYVFTFALTIYLGGIMKDTKLERRQNGANGMYICLFGGCGGAVALTTLVLAPLYTYLANDFLIGSTILPELIEIALDLLDIVAFAACYSALIFSATFFGRRMTFRICSLYFIICVLKGAANLLLTKLFSGYIADVDVLSVCLALTLETAQLTFVALYSSAAANKYHKDLARIQKAALRTGDRVSIDVSVFTSVYSASNPMQRSALCAGIMLSLIKIISRILYDLAYGAPNDLGEALIMAVYYFSDVLVLAVFYAFCWFILTSLGRSRSREADSAADSSEASDSSDSL